MDTLDQKIKSNAASLAAQAPVATLSRDIVVQNMTARTLPRLIARQLTPFGWACIAAIIIVSFFGVAL